MKSESTINAREVIAKFREMDYANLNEIFRSAIDKSVQILKNATISELQATGVNVSSPVHSHGRSYPALIRGVIGEVSDSGTEGRVRVAPASKKGYSTPTQGSHALKWFEQGTQERYRKPAGTYKARDQYGHVHKYKREVGEGKTGKIKDYGFFNTAINSTESQVSESLEQNINNAINQIWNR